MWYVCICIYLCILLGRHVFVLDLPNLEENTTYVYIYMYVCIVNIYIYIRIFVFIYFYVCIYIYIEGEELDGVLDGSDGDKGGTNIGMYACIHVINIGCGMYILNEFMHACN